MESIPCGSRDVPDHAGTELSLYWRVVFGVLWIRFPLSLSSRKRGLIAMKTRAVVLHLDAESDRDREAILARLESATGRDGALGSILDATVRRELKRAIARRRALVVRRWSPRKLCEN